MGYTHQVEEGRNTQSQFLAELYNWECSLLRWVAIEIRGVKQEILKGHASEAEHPSCAEPQHGQGCLLPLGQDLAPVTHSEEVTPQEHTG